MHLGALYGPAKPPPYPPYRGDNGGLRPMRSSASRVKGEFWHLGKTSKIRTLGRLATLAKCTGRTGRNDRNVSEACRLAFALSFIALPRPAALRCHVEMTGRSARPCKALYGLASLDTA